MKYRSQEELVEGFVAGDIQGETYSRSMFFEKNAIYSYGYHFPIAKRVLKQDGSILYLFTSQGYSNSTAKHKSIVSKGLMYKQVLYCEFIPSVAEFDLYALYKNLVLSIEKAKKITSKKVRTRHTALCRRDDLYHVYHNMERLTQVFFPEESIGFATGMIYLHDICLPR